MLSTTHEKLAHTHKRIPCNEFLEIIRNIIGTHSLFTLRRFGGWHTQVIYIYKMMIGSGIERSQKSGWSIGSCRVFSTFILCLIFLIFLFLIISISIVSNIRKKETRHWRYLQRFQFHHFLIFCRYFYSIISILYIFLKNEIELEIIVEKNNEVPTRVAETTTINGCSINCPSE